MNEPRRIEFIIATINTSDESIYYLNSAFKRPWDWEYIDAPSDDGIEDDESITYDLLKVKLILEEHKGFERFRRYLVNQKL